MIPCSDDFRHATDKSLAPFHQKQERLSRKQRQQGGSSKANRQLVKRNPPSSSGEIDFRISSPNPFTQNGNKLYFRLTLNHRQYNGLQDVHDRRSLRALERDATRGGGGGGGAAAAAAAAIIVWTRR
ncbi:unnamed protein product [Protopolystoma xenopodis]|uniref:Uncharacterized protein n=1 Tax=Protopolystoma xenopodis TaxID=117903 RepID=A0A448WF35_9PLAT|nr:unnamed protein product [Protopolystoma xenopodis]